MHACKNGGQRRTRTKFSRYRKCSYATHFAIEPNSTTCNFNCTLPMAGTPSDHPSCVGISSFKVTVLCYLQTNEARKHHHINSEYRTHGCITPSYLTSSPSLLPWREHALAASRSRRLQHPAALITAVPVKDICHGSDPALSVYLSSVPNCHHSFL